MTKRPLILLLWCLLRESVCDNLLGSVDETSLLQAYSQEGLQEQVARSRDVATDALSASMRQLARQLAGSVDATRDQARALKEQSKRGRMNLLNGLSAGKTKAEDRLRAFEEGMIELLDKAIVGWFDLRNSLQSTRQAVSSSMDSVGQEELGASVNASLSGAIDQVTSFVGTVAAVRGQVVGLGGYSLPEAEHVVQSMRGNLQAGVAQLSSFPETIETTFRGLVDGIGKYVKDMLPAAKATEVEDSFSQLEWNATATTSHVVDSAVLLLQSVDESMAALGLRQEKSGAAGPRPGLLAAALLAVAAYLRSTA